MGDPDAADEAGHAVPGNPVSTQDVLDVAPAVRAVIVGRISDRQDVDDLVQDALERLLTVRHRLARDTLIAYAIITARHLSIGHQRTKTSRATGLHRLVDLSTPLDPSDNVLTTEERTALNAALAQLPDAERNELLAHHLLRDDQAQLPPEPAPGSVRVRLARTRAKVRVDYILSLRRVELPTRQCRPVLLAISNNDAQRQEHLRAGQHLLACPTCAELVDPIARRQRGLILLAPLALLYWANKAVRAHPATTGITAAAAAAGAITAGVILAGGHSANPAPRAHVAVTAPTTTTPPATIDGLTTNGAPLQVPTNSTAIQLNGQPVVAAGGHVLSTPTHNGFWVGQSAAIRVWVQLVGPIRYIQITPGETVSFTGRMVTNQQQFYAAVGSIQTIDLSQLRQEGMHIEATTTGISINP